MQYIELHNVEYGECIVLGGGRGEILMVDCGSMNRVRREDGRELSLCVNEGILERYRRAPSRAFLLSHCHRDHLSGFWNLLGKEPKYFNQIFLPASPCDHLGRALLLEFALFIFVFLRDQTDYSRANIASLRLYERASRASGPETVRGLAAGDSFTFDNVTYDVLWPRREDYPFSDLFANAVEELNVELSSPFLPSCAAKFQALKNEFCRACCRAASGMPLTEETVSACTSLLLQIDELAPQLNLLPPAPDVREILNRPVVRTAYADELNAASLVFHNRRTQEASLDDILMTGDAAPETFDAIADQLYPGYYILKAPHHGTASHWSHLFSELSADHILISTGDYDKGGKIAPEYAEFPAVKHCTNAAPCDWCQSRGCSCNRMAVCYDLPSGPGLAIKCPFVRGVQNEAPCRIYLIGPSGRLPCLCDACGGQVAHAASRGEPR